MINQTRAFFLGVCVLMMTGCAASRPAPESEDTIRFSIRNADGVHVSTVRAASDEGGMIVYGVIKRTSPYSFHRFRGHVDMEISTPDGAVIRRASVPIQPVELPRRGFHSARFALHMDSALQPGTTVRITPHNAEAEYPAD